MSRRLVALALACALAAALMAPAALLAAEGDPATPPLPDVQAAAGQLLPQPAQPDPAADGPPAQQPPVSQPGDGASAPAARSATTAASEARDRRRPVAFAAAPGSVTIRDFSFAPSSITVAVGETVTWNNAGPTPHTATADDGSFDTGLLSKGESGSHRFTRAGNFSYFCEPHPNMKGTVRVVAASSGGDDPASDSQGTETDDPGSGTAGAGSGEGGSGSAGSSSSGSRLPATGADAGALLFLGLALLALSVAVRRRIAQPRA